MKITRPCKSRIGLGRATYRPMQASASNSGLQIELREDCPDGRHTAVVFETDREMWLFIHTMVSRPMTRHLAEAVGRETANVVVRAIHSAAEEEAG